MDPSVLPVDGGAVLLRSLRQGEYSTCMVDPNSSTNQGAITDSMLDKEEGSNSHMYKMYTQNN